MNGFYGDIENETLGNENFRKVVYTAKHSQLVLMNIPINSDIGVETHNENDQFFRVEHGEGKCVIDGKEHELKNGTALVVPAGAEHNIINTSNSLSLKLYTIYSPPHHKDGVVHATKEDAEKDKTDEFEGETTE